MQTCPNSNYDGREMNGKTEKYLNSVKPHSLEYLYKSIINPRHFPNPDLNTSCWNYYNICSLIHLHHCIFPITRQATKQPIINNIILLYNFFKSRENAHLHLWSHWPQRPPHPRRGPLAQPHRHRPRPRSLFSNTTPKSHNHQRYVKNKK